MDEYRLQKAPSFSRMKGSRCSSHLAVFLLACATAATSFVDAFVTIRRRSSAPKQQQQHYWTTTFLRESTSETTTFETNLPTAAQWQSHVSTHPEGITALEQIWENLSNKESNFGLAFLFVGQAHAKEFEMIVEKASERLLDNKKNCQLISVLGGGVIGENVELDQMGRPSLSLLVGSLPDGAKVKVSEYNNRDTTTNDNSLRLDDAIHSCLIFSDPYVPMDKFLSNDDILGDRVVAGGISCPLKDGQASLAIGNKCLSQGSMVIIGFAGSIKLQCMVAQGSRPIGKIYTITASEQNLITELDNEPSVDVLTNVANSASDEEKALMQTGFLCGIASESSNNEKGDSSSIDFLTRQIIGMCRDPLGFAIGANNVRKGDLFCFQVLNGKSAEQDLEIMVQRAKTARLFDNTAGGSARPMAALQISCVARGRDMFDGVPNVDLSKIRQLVEDRPVVGGFYANGEIGPVGLSGFSTTKKGGNGQSYIHSFTTVAVLLCEDQPTKKDETSKTSSSKEDSPLDAWG